MTPADRARLRELMAKATPGPWVDQDDWDGTVTVMADTHECEPPKPNIALLLQPSMSETHVGHELEFDQHVANAKLIALARTALPALLDRVEALEATLREIESGDYHDDLCVRDQESGCHCADLDAALAALPREGE